MTDDWLIASIVALALAVGAFLDRMLQWFSWLRRPPEPSLQLKEQAQAVSKWLACGRGRKLVNETGEVEVSNIDALKSWLKEMPPFVALQTETLDVGKRTALEKKFWIAFLYLVLLGLVAGRVLLKATLATVPQVLTICITAGLFGSCIAALRSCLDRRANGFEDEFGNAAPNPKELKERFSEGMFFWFMGRPMLGAAVGVLVYLGVTGEVFSEGVAKSLTGGAPTKLAFVAVLGGLFAKTLLDLLLETTKKIFRV